jgi:hypothetical protein
MCVVQTHKETNKVRSFFHSVETGARPSSAAAAASASAGSGVRPPDSHHTSHGPSEVMLTSIRAGHSASASQPPLAPVTTLPPPPAAAALLTPPPAGVLQPPPALLGLVPPASPTAVPPPAAAAPAADPTSSSGGLSALMAALPAITRSESLVSTDGSADPTAADPSQITLSERSSITGSAAAAGSSIELPVRTLPIPLPALVPVDPLLPVASQSLEDEDGAENHDAVTSTLNRNDPEVRSYEDSL